MSNFVMTSDQALDHCLNHARVVEGLVGHVRIQDAGSLPPDTIMNVVASALELVDVLGKLDEHLRGGGLLPSSWHAAER